VIRDLAVMLADGGECVADLGAVRDQQALFGPVASDSTAFRVIDRIASQPGLLDALRAAHARARERFWERHPHPARSCRLPTTTATAPRPSSPTSPTSASPRSSAATASAPHIEDRIRDDKDTGLAKFPFKEFALNQVWLQIVLLAHDLIVWTQALLLDGELAKAEPKRLRYRLLHVAARLAFHGRRAKLRLQHDWPWGGQLLAAFQKLKQLPAATA
jgi:hypothetical protein